VSKYVDFGKNPTGRRVGSGVRSGPTGTVGSDMLSKVFFKVSDGTKSHRQMVHPGGH
jgi:hypothetical protein